MTKSFLFGRAALQTLGRQRQSLFIINSYFNWAAGSSNISYILSKPNFLITPHKITVTIFYYGSDKGKLNDFSLLGNSLTRCWSRLVELRLVRLSHVALDSNILGNNISYNTNKFNFNRIVKLLKSKISFSNILGSNNVSLLTGDSTGLSLYPSTVITGIKLKLGGRLTTQRAIPRQTTQNNRLGYKGLTVDNNLFTSKNKLGAFTIKVSISQYNT